MTTGAFFDPSTQGLLALSAGLLEAGGPQQFPTSFGQALGRGAMGGLSAANAAQQNQLRQALLMAQVQQAARTQAIQEEWARQHGIPIPGASLPGIGGALQASPALSNQPASNVGALSAPPVAGAISPVQLPPYANEAMFTDMAFNQGKGMGDIIMKANTPISGRAGAPMWGVGPDGKPAIVGFAPKLDEGMTMDQSGNVSVAPGYAPTASALSAIPKPGAGMQTVKVSNQRELQLSQPEYLRYTQSGGTVLPQRYNILAKELPGVSFSNEANAPTAPAPQSKAPGGDVGVLGATQSQSEQIQQAGQTASNTEAGKEFISETRKNYGLLRDVPAALANMDRAKVLAASNAGQFMGPLGESKLQITKFFRANIPGMQNLNTEGVKSVEELRSSLFNQVMDNLKKMDAQPSQYQQQVMQEAFGTLGTDPKSVPNILNVFGDILKNRVAIHNQTVDSAEARGTRFPYDVHIKLPAASAVPNVNSAPTPGTVRKGYKFKGGDPSRRENWAPIMSGSRG